MNMRSLFWLMLLLTIACDSAENSPADDPVEDVVALVDSTRIHATINELSAFSDRRMGTSRNDSVRQILTSRLQELGYIVNGHAFTDRIKGNGQNIIARTSTLRGRHILLGAHFDAVGPGANDNGSGVAAVIEIARIFSELGRSDELKIILFDGEEDGLLGSNAYVDDHPAALDSIRFMLNLDMIGGFTGMTHYTIVCEEDGNNQHGNDADSQGYNQILMDAVRRYSDLNPVCGPVYASDYVAFEAAGVAVIGLYEYRGQLDNPYYETVNDLPENLHPTYLVDAVRSALGFLAGR